VREVYAWAVGQQDAPASPITTSLPVTVAAATPAKPPVAASQPIDIATLFPTMATPERIEIVASQQNEDALPLRRESAPAGEDEIAPIQLRTLPQPPVLLSSGMVEILASLGTPAKKAA
jgi:hypothetical protein